MPTLWKKGASTGHPLATQSSLVSTRNYSSRLMWLLIFSAALLVAGLQAVFWPQYQAVGSELVAASPAQYPIRLEIPAPTQVDVLPSGDDSSSDPVSENALALIEPADDSSPVTLGTVNGPVSTRPEIDVLLPVEYDLSRGGDSEGTIEVEKTLMFNGKKVSPLPVKIVGGATILVSRSDLLGRLEAEGIELKGAEMLPNVEHVSFRQLRNAGLEVRYDPVADAIILKPEG